MTTRLIFLSLCFVLSKANATGFKADAGSGLTDNANLTSFNQKSDVFLKAVGTYSWKDGEHQAKARVGYTDYLKENINDALFWSVDDKYSPGNPKKDWAFKGNVFGRHYTKKSPGSTDESFSHIGIGGAGERSYNLAPKLSLNWGPHAEYRKYIQNSTRADTTIGAEVNADYEIKSDLVVGAFSNFSMVFSNQSAYSRYFLDLGANVDYNFKKDWTWFTEASIRETYFTSRKVTTVTETTVSRGKNAGRSRVTTGTALETFSGFVLFSQVSYNFRSNQKLSGDLTVMSQSSASGNQDYSATELFGRWTFIF